MSDAMTPAPLPWTSQSIRARMRALTQPDEALSEAQCRTRARLIEVATEHFTRAGYRKASVAQIARAANVGKGSVYLYVQSKEHLLVTCVVQEKMLMLPKIQEVLSLPKAQQLEAMIYANVQFCMSAPLCGALIRGDDDFEALKRSLRVPLVSPPEQKEDEQRSWALYNSLIRALTPDASEATIAKIRATILATIPVLAHLKTPAHRGGMSVEEFARMHAKLMVQGVANSVDTHA